MKFYETHFEEYITAVDKYNLHPELARAFQEFPSTLANFENLIVYGASGIGKYSQVLHFLKRYSPSELKYEKKMTIETDKQSYIYRISDIHYEIDMSFLGCNSKQLWHELFLQIVDIISMKPEKIGIIVCKNFHMIHSELLDIFYQYMQQYNNTYMNILIKYVLITEQLSFIPANILNSCEKLAMKRPCKQSYQTLLEMNKNSEAEDTQSMLSILSEINPANVLNLKELHSFAHVRNTDELPTDIFNIVCNQIIDEMSRVVDYSKFRDSIYDILIYNLDVTDCLWYILSHFVEIGKLDAQKIGDIMNKFYPFLKYYNNNYRPIYHLESILFYFIIKINGFHEQNQSHGNPRTESRRKRDHDRKPAQTKISNVGKKVSSG
jgi:hypothetical protein